jgi:hypothetical protein
MIESFQITNQTLGQESEGDVGGEVQTNEDGDTEEGRLFS